MNKNPFAYLHNTIPSSLPPLRISNSAPVTPPLSSPTSKCPKPNNFSWESFTKQSISQFNLPFFASSAPTSPTRYQRVTPATIPECDESDCSTIDSCQWVRFKNYEPMLTNPNSPTYNLVKPMAPMTAVKDAGYDKGKGKGKGMEFEFENGGVKAWEGERIHDVGLQTHFTFARKTGSFHQFDQKVLMDVMFLAFLSKFIPLFVVLKDAAAKCEKPRPSTDIGISDSEGNIDWKVLEEMHEALTLNPEADPNTLSVAYSLKTKVEKIHDALGSLVFREVPFEKESLQELWSMLDSKVFTVLSNLESLAQAFESRQQSERYRDFLEKYKPLVLIEEVKKDAYLLNDYWRQYHLLLNDGDIGNK